MAIVSPLRPGPPGADRTQRAARARSGVSSWYAALRDALDAPADVLLPAARRLGAAADHRPDHGAQRLERLLLPELRRQLLRRRRQAADLGARSALPCAWVAGRLPQRWVRRLAWPGYVVSLGAAAADRRSSASRRNGNRNWLALGPILIQPSEIAKLALVLWAAHVYANKDRRLGNLHQIMMPVVPGLLLATGLVVFGHDLGTALVLFAILLGMLWVVGAPARLFALSFLVISVFAGALAAADPERLTRITTSPTRCATTTAPAGSRPTASSRCRSGGLFGQGIGASQQKWGNLPEAHTDFIFAVLGEELGLVGTLLVLGLFLTIAYAAIRVARRTKDPFVRYMTFGIVVWLIGQMMINVGMVLALLPVIGIPLPLVSYGGSALVPSLVALGMLVGFARREPEAARALAQRKRARNSGVTAGSVDRAGPVARCGSCSREVGSAGHTSPLLATADALQRLAPGVEITCLGTRERIEAQIIPAAGYPLELVPQRAAAAPAERRPAPAARSAPRPRGGPRSRWSTGSGPTWSSASAATSRCRPTSRPARGRCRWSSTRATRCPASPTSSAPGSPTHVATSFPDTPLPARDVRRAADPPDDLHPRPGRPARRGAARRSGCDADLPTLLVTGGSQGAASINQAVLGAAPAFADGRRPGAARRRARRTRSTPPDDRRARTSCSATSTGWTSPTPPPTPCSAAAGANTVTEVSGVGLPAVFVPLPIGNGEQALNARPVVEAGGGLLVDDADADARVGRRARRARLLTDPRAAGGDGRRGRAPDPAATPTRSWPG